ncbi:MAG: L-threonylcarbamoyladenylate synthase [Thermoplasmatales archaeon]
MKVIIENLKNVQEVLDAMNEGPVVLPTDTLYALSAPIRSKEQFDKVYKLKNKPMESASPIGFYGLREMEKYCNMDEGAKNIVRNLMPGPLTLVLEAKIKGHWVVNGKIAARIPDRPFVREVIRRAGPITLVGANIRGYKASSDMEEILKQFRDSVGLYVKAENIGGIPSTIYDYTSKKLLREGQITLKQIRELEYGN